MYLDQPGLMGLWDRMKAVFAGKSDVSESEQKLSSKGLQLVANGTGITGDNTNFSQLTYDATKSSGMSSGSFTYAKGKRGTISTDGFVPLTTGRDYRISFDLMSDGGNATAYGCILFYDADKLLIEAQHCMYKQGSTTKLARDLKKGDTEVFFESLDGWKDAGSRVFAKSIIFWDYANSFGYTYPPETYSRYFHYDLYAADSAVDKVAKKITLSKPWAFEEHKAGTPVSQNESGSTYKYFGIGGTKVPTEWTTYEDVLKGEVDYSGGNVSRTIPPGTAYARPGFLWNHNLSGDQLWMTNLSLGYLDPMTEDGINAALEKLPVWSGYPQDRTQLIRRDNGGGSTYGRVTFLTVWNYIKGKADSLYAAKSHTHDASWAMAHSMAASKTLTAASADMPLTTASGDATLSSGGLKLAKAGTALIVASLSLGAGFTANDQVHLRIAVNGAHKGQDVVQRVVSTGYGTVQLTTVLDVAADDVVMLRAWNATAARGTVQAGNSTRLMVAYL